MSSCKSNASRLFVISADGKNAYSNYAADSESHKLPSDTSVSFANCQCILLVFLSKLIGLTSILADSIDWNRDQLTWGYAKQSEEQIMRTAASGIHVPALPMYMQMSIWPGGEASAPGTAKWAGGKIDWQGRRYLENNRTFQVVVKSITVECGDEARADQAYKYIKLPESGELGYKMVDLKGYGVAKKGDSMEVLTQPLRAPIPSAPVSGQASAGQALSGSQASDSGFTTSTGSDATTPSGEGLAAVSKASQANSGVSKMAFSTSFSTQVQVFQSGAATGDGSGFVENPIMTLPTAPLPSDLKAMVSGMP